MYSTVTGTPKVTNYGRGRNVVVTEPWRETRRIYPYSDKCTCTGTIP